MKKFVAFVFLLVFSVVSTAEEINFYYCGGGWDEDSFYFNLFMQEIIDEPQYYPFLKTYEDYYSSYGPNTEKNENIEQWQAYLGLGYEETEYLVFKATEKDLRTLLDGEPVSEPKLEFADPEFVKKHRQSLLYLAYAKYLEPYMKRKSDLYYGNQWAYEKRQDAGDLDYDRIKEVLKRSWKAEKDKELKLRYGYQLVRLAHYTNHFQEAIDYFNTYVEPLNHRPIIYYYALDQKAGAERGLGNYMQANTDFFTFFVHTKNRKQMAYQSMKVTKELDLEALLKQADSEKARNDVFLLLGFNDFNNPLSSLKNIIKNTPDAIQAKVLMARAINQLEREILPIAYYCYNGKGDCLDDLEDRKIPFVLHKKQAEFLEQTFQLAQQQSNDQRVKEGDFWKLAAAYLAMLKKDYNQSKAYLGQVHSQKEKYRIQKQHLELLLELLHRDRIDEEFEESFLADYKNLVEFREQNQRSYYRPYSTGDFVRDVLANRYFLQGAYGKAFLTQNKITALESNPDWRIIADLEKLTTKASKNDFEKYLMEKAIPSFLQVESKTHKFEEVQVPDFDYAAYLAHMRGTRYLAEEKLEEAKKEFEQLDPHFVLPRSKIKGWFDYDFDGYSGIPSKVFGVKYSGRFKGENQIDTTYIADFSFIPSKMNKLELTKVLIRLKELAGKSGNKGAKANLLLGNFYYNTTTFGYYRYLLNFDLNNRNGLKYGGYWGYGGSNDNDPSDYSKRIYFKNFMYTVGYRDDFEQSLKYYENGLNKVKDREMEARLLFAASQSEQGLRYTLGEADFAKQNEYINPYSEAYVYAFKKYVTKNYRTYFSQLKERFEGTPYYEELQSHCSYFNYYTTRY